MAITVDQIKELRAKTSAGMADCKKALEESDGDMEKAIEYLRKKGAALATKRADKAANEGAIKSKISGDKSTGVIIEVNCETDFVSKGDDFQKFAEDIAQAALDNTPGSVDELLNTSVNGLTVQQKIDEMMGKVGEKIELKDFKTVKVDGGFVSEYIHFGSKLGSLIGIKGQATDDAVDIGNKIAMQIVAMNPIAINRAGITDDVIAKEKEIYTTQSQNEGKPENIIEKIVNNKVEKFYQDNTLLEQEYIQDPDKNVQGLLDEFEKKSGNKLELVEMVRLQLG
ncbi:MAG: elongation factor Ts [Ignavibacteriae bacterium]|nr:elongation factor Ts [Ignavibacteriota bacterium]MCB9242349.1 elongation factor Ts [Ignavibacteriales bacterium]